MFHTFFYMILFLKGLIYSRPYHTAIEYNYSGQNTRLIHILGAVVPPPVGSERVSRGAGSAAQVTGQPGALHVVGLCEKNTFEDSSQVSKNI